MKKYIQLLIVLVAAICFLMMAFYERRYSKLYTVLKYMPWSGKTIPDYPVHCQTKDNSVDDNHWLESAQGIFIYSAFLLHNRSSVHITALQKNTDQNKRITCSFLYDDTSNFVNSYVRTFEVRRSGDWSLNVFACALNKDKETVQLNGIALLAPDAIVEHTYSVLAPSSNTSRNKESVLVACVRPLQPGFADISTLVEFIEIQRAAGVERMVFYHRGIGLTVQRLLNQESRRGFVKVLPFALPLNTPEDLLDSSAFLDCFLRSSTEDNVTVVHLGLEDFFMTSDSKQFQDAVPKGFSGLLTFKTNFFCTELGDDIIARTLRFPFLTLRKTKRLKQSISRSILVLQSVSDGKRLKLLKNALDPAHLTNMPSAVAEFKNSVVLNHYGPCGAKKISKGVETDTKMLKQKNTLLIALQLYVKV